jgi:hypothetical protein
MLPAALPYEYLQHIDRGERIRRSRDRPNGSRVRRVMPRLHERR